MPTADKFLKGFNLVPGTKLGGYTLLEATSTHETIIRYQEYLYHITLVFRGDKVADHDQLFKDLMSEISKEPIVYGVRNPYRCKIDTPVSALRDENGDIIVELTGHAYRI